MKLRNFGKDTSLEECMANVRRESGLDSKAFTAKLADTGLPVVKAEKWQDYEAGTTTPSLESFHTCLCAAGFRLQVVKNG